MRIVLGILAIIGVSAAGIPGQQQMKPDVVFSRSRMPSTFWRPLESLGNRVQVPGNERTTFTGDFTDSDGSRSVLLILQLPGLIRLAGFSRGGGVLLFNGDRPRAGLTSAQESVIESLVMDTPEGLFSAIQRGAAARLIGSNFGPDPRREPDSDRPRYDIYELAVTAQTRTDETLRFKRYYFDTRTGLLLSTRYYDQRDGRRVRIETRFSGWSNVSGSLYPSQIERYEDGQLDFRFTAKTVSSGPQQDLNTFQIP
jgi:hypothetical protein